MYGCVRTVRGGGLCQRKRLVRGIGPKSLTLCRFHETKYNEDRAALLKSVSYDHDQGLHGEGEDRRQFAENYTDVTGEFWLFCQKCHDGLVADEIGVGPEQIEMGKKVQFQRDSAYKTEANVSKRFYEYVNDKPWSLAHAVEVMGESVRAATALATWWRRVDALMETGEYDLVNREYVKLNMVDAYERVKEKAHEDLIRNRLDDQERQAASQFVRLSTY